MLTVEKTLTGAILVLCDDAGHWLVEHLADHYSVFQLPDFQSASNALQSITYDLIIIDEMTLSAQTLSAVSEIRRRFQSLPILVFSERNDITYHERLVNAGADGAVSPSMDAENLQLQVQLAMARHTRSRTLIDYTRKLHAITFLPRLLENATEPQAVIAQLVRFLGSMLNTCGIAVLLKAPTGNHLYAGATDINNSGIHYETNYKPHRRDPYLWTLQSGHSQVYVDICTNPHFVPIPGFPQSMSAAIVPLVFQHERIGVLAVFSPPDLPISHQDLVIYDQIAFQVATFLRYASMYEDKHMMNQANTFLLQAWDRLAELEVPSDVADSLCDLVQTFLPGSYPLVWLESGDALPVIAYRRSSARKEQDAAYTANNAALIRQLGALVDRNGVTMLSAKEIETGSPLGRLIASQQAKYLLIRPVMVRDQSLGGALAAVGHHDPDDWSERYVFDNLIRIGETIFERIGLNQTVREGHDRLTAILAGISEGIFFIDRNNRLTYCNPQVEDLAHITCSDLIGKESQAILKSIADRTSDPAQAFTRLWTACTAAANTNGDAHSISSVSLASLELDVDFEFMPVSRSDHDSIGWIGVMRNSIRTKRADLFRMLLGKLRTPFFQVRNLLSTLAEEHGHLTYGEREHMLRDIFGVVENTTQKWEILSDVFNLQFDTIELNRESIRLPDLLHRIVNSHAFGSSQWRIQITAPQALNNVTIDEFYAKRAVNYLLRRALAVLPDHAPLNIKLEQRGREVFAIFDDGQTSMTNTQIERLAEPSAHLTDFSPHDLSLFIARELLRKNGGRMQIENDSNQHTIVIVSFPVAANNDAAERPATHPIAPATASPDVPSMAVRRAPARGIRSIMMIEGSSTLSSRLCQLLEKQELDVLVYQSADEALADLNATLLDLIIIDGLPRDGSGSAICQRMRKLTEVPIILVYDSATENERVEGLNSGADESISEPIGDEELLARVRAITKRSHIPDRTAEPLVINDLHIDLSRREVHIDGNPVELTRIEYDLLYTLIMNRNQVLTHKQLLSKVWGPEYLDETQYLWVNISRLRKKLEPTPNSIRYIRTQPGVGYYFAADKT